MLGNVCHSSVRKVTGQPKLNCFWRQGLFCWSPLGPKHPSVWGYFCEGQAAGVRFPIGSASSSPDVPGDPHSHLSNKYHRLVPGEWCGRRAKLNFYLHAERVALYMHPLCRRGSTQTHTAKKWTLNGVCAINNRIFYRWQTLQRSIWNSGTAEEGGKKFLMFKGVGGRHIHPLLSTRRLSDYKCCQSIETSWQFV